VKSSHAALGVVVLAVAGLWYAGGGATPVPLPAAAAEPPRVSEPLSHDNLTVYFVHGSDVVASAKVATLQEALAAGWAVVHETGNVNTLAVENRSADCELFIQEGDIIKGGRQDRMIAVDMLLPPKSGLVPFPAHCVEQGRWTGRGNEAAGEFKVSTKCAVGNAIKYANATGQQAEVWNEGKEFREKVSAKVGVNVNAPESETSLQLALENRALQAKVADYENALLAAGKTRQNVVGVVFVVNGQVTGAEVYGSNILFRKAWPKLLNSAAAEALAEKTDGPAPPAPTAQDIESYLASAGQQEQPGVVRTNRTGTFLVGGTVNSDVSLVNAPDVQRVEQDRTVTSFSGRSGATRTRVLASGGAQPQPNVAANPAPNAAGNVIINGEQQLSQNEGRPAVNPDGNRLNVNRVECPAGLVTESRDPARQNAVIHKSFIKK
jgi:hypothetical protein